MRRGRKLVVGCLGVGGLAAVALIYFREPMTLLTSESLAQARARWEAANITDYEWHYVMSGGSYVVTVGQGRVVGLTRNDRETTSKRPEEFTVDGVFDVLERELEILDDPTDPFGGDRRTTFLRVRFDPKLGYVNRYLRAVGGSGRSTSLETLLFETDRPMPK